MALGALVLLAVGQQLLLPRLAERQLRKELAETGQVERVDVSALPAIKLLWQRADRVTILLGEAAPGTERLADDLARTKGIGRLDARARLLRIGPLTLREATLRKRGDALASEASVTTADLRSALPPGFDVRPVAAGGGQLVLQGTASFLGQRFSGAAVVEARDGRLLVVPALPFGGLLTLTVFADPRIQVESVGARATAEGFTLGVRGRLTR